MRDRNSVSTFGSTELGEYIKKAEYKSNELFAQEVGVTAPMLSYIARKRLLPTVEIMARICRLLGITPLDLYEREELDLLGALKERRSGRRRKRKRRDCRIDVQLKPDDYKALKRALEAEGQTIAGWLRPILLKKVRAWRDKHVGEVELMIEVR